MQGKSVVSGRQGQQGNRGNCHSERSEESLAVTTKQMFRLHFVSLNMT